MVLRVSGKNIDIGAALREHVETRVAALSERYTAGPISGTVIFGPEGPGYRTDCNLRLTSGMSLQAEARAQDVYASFDQAAERVEKRLRRYRRRLKDHHPAQNGAAAGETAAEAGAMLTRYVIEAPDEEREEAQDFNPVVVAETAERVKSLSVASAVAELDLSGAPVVVFRHAGHGRVNIVYRRGDGNIGWIDPRS